MVAGVKRVMKKSDTVARLEDGIRVVPDRYDGKHTERQDEDHRGDVLGVVEVVSEGRKMGDDVVDRVVKRVFIQEMMELEPSAKRVRVWRSVGDGAIKVLDSDGCGKR